LLNDIVIVIQCDVNVIKYLYSAHSTYMYQLKGALCPGPYDVKCHHERIFSIDYQN